VTVVLRTANLRRWRSSIPANTNGTTYRATTAPLTTAISAGVMLGMFGIVCFSAAVR
jgi:hypothetical protein